jgi:hypothetical protein
MRAIVRFTNYKKFNFHSNIKITYGDETIAPGTQPQGAQQPAANGQPQPDAQKPK